jgi:tRNA(Ile)-lysidine synthetase-like protein
MRGHSNTALQALDGLEETVSANVRAEIEERVLGAIVGGSLWAPGEKIVVAVSGGPDSLCLLYVLQELEPQHGGHLHVAHLDHGFRGEVSAAEAAHVAGLARDLGIPATVEAVDVPTLIRREGLSTEDAARRARYRFLNGVAEKIGASVIALGHTADDQVETVLMHLIRGTGLSGLRGMRPAAPLPPWVAEQPVCSCRLRLVRPLLRLTREQTEAYCDARGLAPTKDLMNEDSRFLRVRLRQQVVPLLTGINPRFREAVLRLAQTAAWTEDDLQAALDVYWPVLADDGEEAVRLDLRVWEGLPWTLRLLAVRRAVAWVREHVEGVGWQAVVAAGRLGEATVGSEVALIEDLIIRREYEALAVGPRAALEIASPWPTLGEEQVPVVVPGRTDLPGGHALVARLLPREEANWQGADRWEAWVDAERCGRRLWLRHRQDGDRFQPLGMDGQKKLHDFFVDEKVPRGERDHVPLVGSPDEIVWVVGYRVDGRFSIQPETQEMIHLRWERPPKRP